MTEPQPTLPGLDEDAPILPEHLLKPLRETLRLYRDAGLLSDRDAAKVALCEELAIIIGIKRRGGRLSTVSNDARLLAELLDSFVGESQSSDAALAEAMAEWQRVMDAERAG